MDGLAHDPRGNRNPRRRYALACHETVLKVYGPEPVHEGQAIVDALSKRVS